MSLSLRATLDLDNGFRRHAVKLTTSLAMGSPEQPDRPAAQVTFDAYLSVSVPLLASLGNGFRGKVARLRTEVAEHEVAQC